ncbi:predicted protein [Arabidopsis lyrata subsp. lyrata]|uniref:Predicted protein n=1 Tax=Arabidopsis lyrata subsp. lyrata TaxID=81972 RepID=D7MJB5_ARALL|nr:predicted protein [Arabidopsis lyrata subsp. lyrata]
MLLSGAFSGNQMLSPSFGLFFQHPSILLRCLVGFCPISFGFHSYDDRFAVG